MFKKRKKRGINDDNTCVKKAEDDTEVDKSILKASKLKRGTSLNFSASSSQHGTKIGVQFASTGISDSVNFKSGAFATNESETEVHRGF